MKAQSIISFLTFSLSLACTNFSAIYKDAYLIDPGYYGSLANLATGEYNVLSLGALYASNPYLPVGNLYYGLYEPLFAINTSAIIIPNGKSISSAIVNYYLSESYPTTNYSFNVIQTQNNWNESTVDYTNRPSQISTILSNIFSSSTTNLVFDLTNFIKNNYGNLLSVLLLPKDPQSGISNPVTQNVNSYSSLQSSVPPQICVSFS